ncbi:MAG: monovalent cation/H+ antiporter complex subunit F [Nanoarchaeota archaeon]
MIYIYVILLSLIIILIRIIKGPTFADRLIALEPFTSIAILLIVLYALQTSMQFYLDLALLFSMLSFVGILAIAKGVVK